MKALKLIIFTVTAVLMALVVLEIAAGIAGYGPPERGKGYQESKFIPSEEMIWELSPGWSGVEGKGRIRINSMGFRDDEMAVSGPEHEKRILCLGDSVTFGYLVDQEQPWPNALERIYRGAGSNVRVINAGVPGYSTFQEHRQLLVKGLELDPSVVILGYCLNDSTERYSTLAEYGGKERFLGQDTTRRLPWEQRLLRKSAILRLIALEMQDVARREETYSVKRLFEEPLSPEIEEAWEKNKKEIIALNSDVRKKEKKFLLVVFPYLFQMIMKKDNDLHQKRILELCEAEGIKCLDLLPLFYRHRDEPLFLDENHLTPQGHFRAAEAIFGALESM